MASVIGTEISSSVSNLDRVLIGYNSSYMSLDNSSYTTLGLDSKLKTTLWSFLLKYGEKKTIIYSVDTVNQIQDNCDRVALVNNYGIKFIGTYNNFIDSFNDYRLKDVI